MQESNENEPLGLLISAVRRRTRHALAARLAAFDLAPPQFWMLVAIAEERGSSQAELAAWTHSDEPTASRVVKSLAARGLVRGVRDEENRRKVRVELTESGAALAPQLVALARRSREAVEEALTRAERDAMRAALKKIIAHLDEAVGSTGPGTLRSKSDRAAASPATSSQESTPAAVRKGTRAGARR